MMWTAPVLMFSTGLLQDCSGNVATHTQTITVVDDTAPSIAEAA